MHKRRESGLLATCFSLTTGLLVSLSTAGCTSATGGNDALTAQAVGTVVILRVDAPLVTGSSYALRATVKDENGAILGGRSLAWTSSAPTIASVDPNTGVVTAVGEGTATITASVDGKSGSISLAIVAPIAKPAFAVNDTSVCGLTRGGAVFCWGGLEHGDPSWTIGLSSLDPLPLPGGHRFVKIVSSHYATLGLATDGTVWVWGRTFSGEFGDGTADHPLTWAPVAVSGGHVFKDIAAGITHVLGLTTSGETLQWGEIRSKDQLAVVQPVPAPTATGAAFSQVEASPITNVGLTADGKAYAWGGIFSSTPALLPGGHTLVAIVTSHDNSLFAAGLRADGSLVQYTAVCDANTGCSLGWSEVPGITVASIAAPHRTYYALDATGVGFAWGSNNAGQVGDGTTLTRTLPTPVSGDLRFETLGGGAATSLGVTTDGRTCAWGTNDRASQGIGYFGRVVGPSEAAPDASLVPMCQFPGSFRLRMPQNLAVPQGGSIDVPVTMTPIPGGFSADGPRQFFGDIPLALVDSNLPAGVTATLLQSSIPEGQTSAVIRISATADATREAFTLNAASTLAVWPGLPAPSATTPVVVVPPPPSADGSGVPIACSGPSPYPPAPGFWCLTTSNGAATAPHNFAILQQSLAGTTWGYENVCIEYVSDRGPGYGVARFRSGVLLPGSQPTITEREFRFGVLARSSGEPEVTYSGHWLVYHEGIGDPQIEQMTFNPSTGAVGEAWPFTQGCPF